MRPRLAQTRVWDASSPAFKRQTFYGHKCDRHLLPVDRAGCRCPHHCHPTLSCDCVRTGSTRACRSAHSPSKRCECTCFRNAPSLVSCATERRIVSLLSTDQLLGGRSGPDQGETEGRRKECQEGDVERGQKEASSRAAILVRHGHPHAKEATKVHAASRTARLF